MSFLLRNWKGLLLGLAIGAVACTFTYTYGDHVGTTAAEKTASDAAKAREVQYEKDKLAVRQKAFDEQKAIDAQELAIARQRLLDQAKLVAQAQLAESAARTQTATLTNELKRLRHVDVEVEKWYSACLPVALRDSVSASCGQADVPHK